MIALFRNIPRTRRTQAPISNAEGVIYDYNATPEQMQLFQIAVRNVMNDRVLETRQDRMPPEWWWQKQVELPYRTGTLEELVRFNQLIVTAERLGIPFTGLPPQRIAAELVLTSPNYIEALNNVYVSNFNSIKTLSDKTADQVIQQINAGIEARNTPTEIATRITERFDVSESSAKRIANTEVNKAYNDAKLRATDLAADQSGLRAGVIHISALSTTTRITHGARHGNAYTTQQQLNWWNEGANRINCKCSTRSVLINSKGELFDVELQQEIKAERSFFDENT